MWFSSSERAARPRRRPSHATLVAYLALVIAILGASGAATAAVLIHTRNIADGAVTTAKIRQGAVGTLRIREQAVGTHRIRDRAVTGRKVADNTLTGRQINEATLHISKIAHVVTGTETVPLSDHWAGNDYPLNNPTHTQPANTAEFYFGSFNVHFPADCTGHRWAQAVFRVDNRWMGEGYVSDTGDGQATTVTGPLAGYFFRENHQLVAATPQQRTVAMTAYGRCDGAPTVHPEMTGATINVVRYH